MYATRISLLVGVLATAISTVIGVILGLIAGYFGGAADMIIMRFTDMVMSFPYILLVLVAASIFKPGLWSIILILGFVDWPGIARLVRGNVLSLRESNFIKSDLVAGMPLPYILFSEILPNTAAVSYTHLRAHETDSYLVCRLLLEKKKKEENYSTICYFTKKNIIQ